MPKESLKAVQEALEIGDTRGELKLARQLSPIERQCEPTPEVYKKLAALARSQVAEAYAFLSRRLES